MQDYQYTYGDKPLEGYTIQRAAGRGGFGEVYYAVSDSGRQVALKTVQTHEQIELRGITQCMNLKSPHLVTIFDVKYNEQGRPFVIMEYVSGMSLRDLLNESPGGIGKQKAAFFLREIAKGLSYLHECGIVHRDLKPSNIFYENGYVKIGDYGLTKAITASRHSGQTITVGTVHYMAPEIGEGKYDFSIDIYALGILLYEMLTGEVPFFGASPAEVLMKHLKSEPDMRDIDETFARVIKKALAKEPRQRYKTVQEMVEDVFGTEHIRQSVSQFAPESLSVIAEHVAQKTKNDPPPHPKTGSDNLSSLGEQIGRRLGQAGDRLAERLARAGSRGQTQGVRIADTVGRNQRCILGMITLTGMSLGVGALEGENEGFTALMAMMGAVSGISLARWKLLPNAEPGQWRNFLTGFIGIFLATVLSMGSLNRVFRSSSPGVFFIIGLVALGISDWWKLTAPDRKERIDWGHVIGMGVLAFFVGPIFAHGHGILLAAFIMGTIISVQIVSPFGIAVAKTATAPSSKTTGGRWHSFIDRVKERSGYHGDRHSPFGDPVTPKDHAKAKTPSGRNLMRYTNPPWLRALFVFGAVVCMGISLFAWIAMGAMNLHDEEFAIAMSFGIGGALSFFFCLGRAIKHTRISWYRYLIKPLIIHVFVLISVYAFSCMGSMNLQHNEFAAAMFFGIFSIFLSLTCLFIPARVVEEMTGVRPSRAEASPAYTASPRSRLTALLLAVLPGVFALNGLHRFYAGKVLSGILWLLTLGLFGIGQLIDIILIVAGGFTDAEGRLITEWTRESTSPKPYQPPPPAQSEPPIPPSAQTDQAAEKPDEAVTPPPVSPAPKVTSATSSHASSVWSAVSRFDPIGRLLAAMGFAMLFIAFLIGLAGALHLPWFVQAGFPDVEIGQELTEFFGYAEWPNMIERLAFLLSVLTSLLALTLIILARRKSGALHMLRAVAGIVVLLLAVGCYSNLIPRRYFVNYETSEWQSNATLNTGNGMIQLNQYPASSDEQRVRQMLRNEEFGKALGFLVERANGEPFFFGTILLVVSLVILSWPPNRVRQLNTTVQPLPA